MTALYVYLPVHCDILPRIRITNYVFKVELEVCNLFLNFIFAFFQIDDDTSPKAAKEDVESADPSSQPGCRDFGCSPDRAQLPVTMHSPKVETANGVSFH